MVGEGTEWIYLVRFQVSEINKEVNLLVSEKSPNHWLLYDTSVF